MLLINTCLHVVGNCLFHVFFWEKDFYRLFIRFRIKQHFLLNGPVTYNFQIFVKFNSRATFVLNLWEWCSICKNFANWLYSIMYDEGNHGVKETCAITSAQVKKSNTYQRTYEIDHVSLLQDSTTSSALNFCFFLCILL